MVFTKCRYHFQMGWIGHKALQRCTQVYWGKSEGNDTA